MRRVAITGIGAVTPLGEDINSTWNNLTLQRSGINRITKFDASAFPSRIAGELKEFDPGDFLPAKDILRLDPFIHYAAAAASMAVEDAELASRGGGIQGSGILIGSSRGGITSMDKAMEVHLSGSRSFSPYLMSASTISMASSYLSMNLGTKGPSLGISTACASGASAIGEAFKMIRTGEMNVAIAGGSEAPVCRLAVGGYAASGALSKRNNAPEKASRPFDIDRDGFVIAEGACVLILEELDHALNRNAIIYAELAGYGTSSDAYHQTRPDSEGESLAINKALTDANTAIDEIDYINAHATSTPLGDTAETKAIKEVFGSRTGDIHVSSCKSALGHMLGASGALEAGLTALSIKRGIIPPTINLENPDPECGLNIVTSLLFKDMHAAISNSFGFGGTNAVLVLKKFMA